MGSWLLRHWRALLGVIVVIGIAAAGLLYVYWDQFVPIAALGINYVRYMSAPAGTIETEVAKAEVAAQPSPPTASEAAPSAAEGDWPSYNKTLTSNRFSALSQINSKNADKLKILCTYDTGQYTGFTSGLLEVNGALIFVTEYDLFSIDPSTCKENWRTHEDYQPATPQGVNRGAAYLDGMLFRGTQDSPRARLRLQDGQTDLGDDDRRCEKGRERAGRSDRLERLGLHRQRRRRHQGRQGAHVRARRQDRQDRLGILPGAEGRGRSNPWAARRLAARRVDLGEHNRRRADHRRRDLDLLHVGPGYGLAVRAGRQSRA